MARTHARTHARSNSAETIQSYIRSMYIAEINNTQINTPCVVLLTSTSHDFVNNEQELTQPLNQVVSACIYVSTQPRQNQYLPALDYCVDASNNNNCLGSSLGCSSELFAGDPRWIIVSHQNLNQIIISHESRVRSSGPGQGWGFIGTPRVG